MRKFFDGFQLVTGCDSQPLVPAISMAKVTECAPNERNYLGDGRSTKFLNLKLENVTSRMSFKVFIQNF